MNKFDNFEVQAITIGETHHQEHAEKYKTKEASQRWLWG